ncbi:hypothetical protein NKH77_42005 [Streptomyces sp. M19]
MPESDRERFKSWSDAFLNTTGYTRAETDAAHREFASYMSALIAEKRARPGRTCSACCWTAPTPKGGRCPRPGSWPPGRRCCSRATRPPRASSP